MGWLDDYEKERGYLKKKKKEDDESYFSQFQPKTQTTAPQQKKGFLDYITGGVKKAWDTIERVDSGWKTAHAQTLKNMRQNVLEDYQEKNKDKLKPTDYLRPTFSTTANEAFKHDEKNTFVNFLDSLFDKRNVKAFKEGYREKGKTTGKDIAELSLPNASPGVKKAFGIVSDIVDSPASIVPVMGAEKTAAKLLPTAANLAGKSLPASKLATTALQAALAGGIHGTVRGIGQDKHGWDIAKSAAEDAALFGAMGVAGHGIGKALGAVGDNVKKGFNIFRNPKTGKVELVNDIPKDILQLPQSKIAGLLPEPKKTNFYADSSGTSYKTLNEFDSRPKPKDFVSDILRLPSRNPKALLPEGTKPNFYAGEKGATKTLQDYDNYVKSLIPPRSSGKYTIKNPALDAAMKRYDDAISQIQNHFGTNELRVNEVNSIKSELGIDLDKIVSDIARAEKPQDFLSMLERNRMAQIAGVKEQPNISQVSSGPKKKILTRLDEMEGQVRERINSRKGRLNSNPFEDLTDYSALGAIKIAKGTVKFADWSASMVKEFGEEIKPHLQRIYDQALKIHSTYTKEFKNAPVDPTLKTANLNKAAQANNTAIANIEGKIKKYQGMLKKVTDPKQRKEIEYRLWQEKEKLTKAQGRAEKYTDDLAGKVPPPTPVEELVGGIDPSKLKDKSGFQLYNTDVYRNFEDVLGDQYEPVRKAILDPLDLAKKEKVEMEEQWLKRLKEEVVDKLGITKDSQLSSAVQRYGEGGVSYFDKTKGDMKLDKYTLEDLKRDFPKDWEKVVEADQWFRKAYDELIDQINATRSQIYPNNPDKLIPKRKDYYRHFRELNGLSGLKNLFETPANISSGLAGISEYTNPKTKFQGFAQKRGYGQYKEDAVGGFLEYLPGASYATKIDPHINSFKGLAEELAKATEGKNDANNFIEYLHDYSRDLAGKTNPMDRYIQKVVGRKTIATIRWINNRVKANTVLGNASSALAQLANIPQGIAYNKQHSLAGISKTFGTILKNEGPIKESWFLKERYADSMYRPFNTKWLDSSGGKVKDMAAWLMETADKIGTHFIWNSAYSKGIAEGAANPLRYADDVTRKLIAGRGVGEVPLMQKSLVTQVFAPFTLEVSNLWRVQKDFVKAKDFGGLATLYLANYMFNRVMEDVKGSGVTFDPIKALQDAYQEDSMVKAGGRLAGEYLSNIPLGQYVASTYPEEGLGGLPTRKELFGKADPTRFGTGPVVTKAVEDPFYKFLPPFGGNQLKKTIGGMEAINEGAVYNPNGKLRYPVEGDAINQLKTILFGPSGAREAKDYYNDERQPLSDMQTQAYKNEVASGKNPKEVYNLFQELRKLRSEQDKFKKSIGDNPTSDNKAQNKQYNKKISDIEKLLGIDKIEKEKNKSKKW